MANDFLNINDLILINDMNLSDVEGITDLTNEAPVLARMPAVSASNGTQHKYLKETGAPNVGFRAVNTGREFDHSVDTLVSIDMKFIDASTVTDVAVAREWKRGADDLILREAQRHLRAAFFKLEQQLFYGDDATQGDTAGFKGLFQGVDASMQKDLSLGGTALTSVWMLRLGDRDCEIVLGNEGQIEMRDPIVQMVVDVADATKQYQAYTQGIDGYMGFKAGGKFSALRIANVATGATGDKLTDDVLYDAFSMFDDNRGPDLIVTHRKAIRDLRDSRTATNPTGVPAPWPTSWEGIPLISTNALTVAEVEET